MNTDLLERLEVAWRPSSGAFERSPLGRMAARYGIGDLETVAHRAGNRSRVVLGRLRR